MNRAFIRNNITIASVLIFLVFVIIIDFIKPGFIYNKDGSFREFGMGYKKKTIIPIWLVCIIVAIMSYYSVLYYLAMPKLL